jgi:hypothetical protein
VLSGGLSISALAQVSGTVLTAGTYDVHTGATLALPISGVTANAATLIVRGTGTLAGLSQGLTSNSGTFELLEGASYHATAAFTNTGNLMLGAGSIFTADTTFAQTATGRVEFQLGGVPASGNFGKLIVTGAATLAGTAALTQVDGFAHRRVRCRRGSICAADAHFRSGAGRDEFRGDLAAQLRRPRGERRLGERRTRFRPERHGELYRHERADLADLRHLVDRLGVSFQ